MSLFVRQKHVLYFLIVISLVFAIVDYQRFSEIRGEKLAISFLYLVDGVNTTVVLVQAGPFGSWQSVSGSRLPEMVNQFALVLLSLTFLL